MSYIVKIDGYEIVCDTAAAVHELISFKPRQTKPAATPAVVKVPTQTSERRNTTTRAFLRAIMSNAEGVTSQSLIDALGFKGPKALGGAMGFVHSFLDEIGLRPEEVYETQKRSDAKYWIAKSKAEAALAAIEGK